MPPKSATVASGRGPPPTGPPLQGKGGPPPKGATTTRPPAAGTSTATVQPGACVHFNLQSPFRLPPADVPPAFAGRVKCVYCLALGVRSAMNTTRIQPNQPNIPESTTLSAAAGAGIDGAAFVEGQELWNQEGFTPAFKAIADKTPAFTVRPPAGLTPISFPSIKGENGETFHALVSAAMTGAVTVNVTQASPGQKMLLENYLPRAKLTGAAGDSKTAATDYIAQTWVQTENDAEKQMQMFQSIRDFINDKKLTTITTPALVQATPSFLSKVWIDAVFKASGQSDTGIPLLSSPAQPAPDQSEVPNRAAVINVRKQANTKATDGRFMEDPVIKLCFNAIAEANLKTVQERGTANQRPKDIKIVILFGDVSTQASEQRRYQALADECLTTMATTLKLEKTIADNFKVYLLSNPFTSAETNREVLSIWTQFKNGAYNDHCPQEAKALAFYLALRDVYQESMVCIGFRSGTLDGAGFMGIPICYFDNTSKTTDPAPPKKEDEKDKGKKPVPVPVPNTANPRSQGVGNLDYLWDMRAYPGKAKSFAIAPASGTNTAFVPTPEILKQAERIEALTMTGNPFIRIQTAAVAPSVDDQTALAAALLVYICLTGSDNRPLWTKRIFLMTRHQDMLDSLSDNSFGAGEVRPGKGLQFGGATGATPQKPAGPPVQSTRPGAPVENPGGPPPPNPKGVPFPPNSRAPRPGAPPSSGGAPGTKPVGGAPPTKPAGTTAAKAPPPATK